ncbi:MAG: hypothetical protein AAF598_11030 [Bacteroidota bacterium]
MPFATLLFLSVFVGIGLFLVFARLGQQEAKKIGERAGELIQDIDDQYESFVNTKLLLAAKEDVLDLSTETLTEEAMLILKPSIDGLLAYVEGASKYATVPIEYYSRYFRNIVPTTESYFSRKYAKQQLEFDLNERVDFSLAFEDAIKSDISKRFLELKAGR